MHYCLTTALIGAFLAFDAGAMLAPRRPSNAHHPPDKSAAKHHHGQNYTLHHSNHTSLTTT
jgi:hypothetical protein